MHKFFKISNAYVTINCIILQTMQWHLASINGLRLYILHATVSARHLYKLQSNTNVGEKKCKHAAQHIKQNIPKVLLQLTVMLTQ